ncbi:hypothetical protein [Nocardia sp. NPDC051570]|uniref:nSTAND1 domain-containing NTPase n=1 Tax=Nocardia sp. NPDC051570 TaxID=3364324 RepID=UPI0037AFFBB4
MSHKKGLFGERLTLLFHAAGTPPTKSVVRAANNRTNGTAIVTEQRISSWRRAHRVPATFEAVRPVLEVLIVEATKRSGATTGLDPSLLDLQSWRADWEASRPDAPVAVCDPNREPYRGLAPFRAEDADLFFGRDSALSRLNELVESAASAEVSLVLLVGRSGTGKSSLLSAGLQAHSRSRIPILLSPGADPLAALRAIPSSGEGDRLILVDQGEELFTQCADETARSSFVDVLLALAVTDVVVLTLDINYVSDFLNYDRLASTVRGQSMLLGAMTDDELREAITAPAGAIGARVDQNLVDALLADVHSAASADCRAALLPLLSHVLREIWSKRKGKTLTLESYRAAGGISGAIAATAERVWSELDDNEYDTARRVLVALTLIGPRTTTRNRVRNDTLVGESTDPRRTVEIIDKFAAARLLVQHDGEVELLHDALLTAWPRMTAWLTEEGEFAHARQRIEEDARAWSSSDRPATLLYEKGRLDNAIELDARTNSLNRLAREFIADSARAAVRRTRTQRILVGAIAALSFAVIALIVMVIVQHATSDEPCTERTAAIVHAAELMH